MKSPLAWLRLAGCFVLVSCGPVATAATLLFALGNPPRLSWSELIPMPQGWWQSWSGLRPGMTPEQVIALLGPPAVVDRRIGHGWARYDYPGYSGRGMNATMYFNGDGQLQEGFRSGGHTSFGSDRPLPRSDVGVPIFPFAIGFGLGFVSLTLETRPRPPTLPIHLGDPQRA